VEAATTSSNKRLVHALVDDDINTRRVVDEPATAGSRVKLRSAVEQFLASFPDWHQQVVEFVEGHACHQAGGDRGDDERRGSQDLHLPLPTRPSICAASNACTTAP
jgi:hypothetical protein